MEDYWDGRMDGVAGWSGGIDKWHDGQAYCIGGMNERMGEWTNEYWTTDFQMA